MRHKDIIFITLLCVVVFLVTRYVMLNNLGAYTIETYSKVADVVVVPQVPYTAKGIKLVFVGDIMLSRKIGEIMEAKKDWNYPFALLGNTIKSADIAFANFENPISDRGILSGSKYSFRANPAAVQGLANTGFDVVSVANNHIWDYGRDAVVDTMHILKSAGISYVGAGEDFSTAHTPVIKNINGVKIAYLGYTNLVSLSVTTESSRPEINFIDMVQIRKDIALAKQQADVVIVSYHWGEEYNTTHTVFQEEIGHQTIDAGANLVIGHHPHVVEEVEKYHGGYIAYSLGNFVFDQNFSTDTSHGGLLEVTIINKKINTVKLLNVLFNRTYQPYVKDDATAMSSASHVTPASHVIPAQAGI